MASWLHFLMRMIDRLPIDRVLETALNAGALGGKINGSGGGDCMFAYAPGHAGAGAEAIERQGGAAYIIRADEGPGSKNRITD